MAISTVDGLLSAMASNRQKFPITKTSAVTTVAGGNGSYWRIAGTPIGQGAIPSTAATCNNTTLGGINFVNPTGGMSTYISRLGILASVVQAIEIHDRLAHMGGLSGTVTTAQTVGIDLNALGSTDNIVNRKGKSDYSAVQWYLEWYSATGSTAATATVTYTNHLGTTGKTTTVSVAASRPAGTLLQIIPASGDNIMSIQSVTLSVSTGTAGSFGVTATLERASIPLPIANNMYVMDWSQLGLPFIYDSSCLFFIGDATTTSVGTLGGSITLVQG